MKNINLILKLNQMQKAIVALAALLMLVSFMALPTSAQIITREKFIFLSGQLTSTNTGAPIPDHEVYILSDSTVNGGFGYYGVTKTDVNGFFRDTLITTTSDGVINIHVFDFENNLIQLDRYYRFVWDNEYLMFADLAIFDPDANMELQANFAPQFDAQENPLKVIFKDMSIGESIKSWFWDFGDGTTSTVQDPEHTYSNSGIYLVTLTVNEMPPGYQGYESSTITKQVQLGLREYHHLGGHIFAQQFPVDFGIAYLYSYDENDKLVLLDTTKADYLGYYYFYEVPAGRYFTKARLDISAELYGQFMPTYFRNTYIWNEAEEIIIDDSDNFECDIWLRPTSGIVAGEGQITGSIIYDTSLVRTPIPAGDIEIILLNTQGDFLTCKLSNIEGQFSFSGIPFGTYQLYPDVTGISTTSMYVSITEEKPSEDDLNLIIFPNEITFAINEQNSDFIENALLLYPNPVTEQARISFEMKKTSAVTVQVTDMSGKLVYECSNLLLSGEQNLVLPVGNLPAGIYQVALIPEDHVFMTSKFLKMK